MARKQRPAPLRIALAQMNTTVGDVEGNARRAAEWIARARGEGAQLVVLPELAINGYPPEDLLLKRHFLAAGRDALRGLASETEGIVALVGFAQSNGFAHNALAVLADGEIQGTYSKMLLPNYGVFDERRYFEPGSSPALIELDGALIGLTICEDVWFPGPPSSAEAMAGASLIVNASASPYHRGKGTEREEMVAQRARETGAAFALCNAVGGQDELVFDGHSVIVSAERRDARPRPPVRRGAARLRPRAPRPRGRRAVAAPIACPAGLEAPVLASVEFGPREAEPARVPDRRAARARGRGLRGAEARAARLRREERLRARRAGALGRHRLGAGRAGRGRRPRRRARHLRRHALPPLQRRDAGRRARDRRQPRGRADRDPDRDRDGHLRAAARPTARARRGPTGGDARPRGREPPGADPRQPRDGALEPLRLARADDRETRASCRSATRRSTATWPAASP